MIRKTQRNAQTQGMRDPGFQYRLRYARTQQTLHVGDHFIYPWIRTELLSREFQPGHRDAFTINEPCNVRRSPAHLLATLQISIDSICSHVSANLD